MNYAEIKERLRRLAARPVRDVPDERMSEVREEMRRKTAKSAALFERAKNVVSHGVEHVLPPPAPSPRGGGRRGPAGPPAAGAAP